MESGALGARQIREGELGDLGIFRIPIPIPFVEAGGLANAYLIEEESGCLLFDTGLGLGPSRTALAEGLARTGHRFEEVNRIILSHGHVDHFGAAAWVLEQTGRAVPVSIHSADADKVSSSGLDWPSLLTRNSGYFSILGMPPAALNEMIAIISNGNSGLGRRLDEVKPLLPGERLACRHVTLEVHHTPGHTPGLCCLYEPGHRLLFSADHLLEHVSPNPLIQLGPEGKPASFKPLVSYFESLNRVRALAVDLVLPGHAAPFSSHVEVINSLFDFYERRQARIVRALECRPLTVYEVMKDLFPPKSGFGLVLTISEALANLELLEEKRKVERVTDGGVMRFRLA